MFRAMKFVHSAVDLPGLEAGLVTSAGGGIETVEGDASVRQAILLLLSTRPGERVMRPDYGCDVHRLTFSPNDDTTAGLAIHYVRRALSRWEPRIDVVRLDANRDEADPGMLLITLAYRVRDTRRTGTLQIPVSLAGDAG
jgi:phage baseplate assembly protein W